MSRESECRLCAPWILKCAHLGELFLQLAGPGFDPDCVVDHGWDERFRVHGPSDKVRSLCEFCAMVEVRRLPDSPPVSDFTTLIEAETEFATREALLLETP